MGKQRVCIHSAPQIFISCLIPNLGAWVIWFALFDKIAEHKEKVEVKSFLDPPEWVIPVTWTVLYILSGIASWRVWSIGKEKAKIPLLIYTIKLLLNWLWPLVAFGLGSVSGAIIDTVVLQVFVVLTGVAFYRIDRLSGLSFIPFFLYICYVLVLCSHIYYLN